MRVRSSIMRAIFRQLSMLCNSICRSGRQQRVRERDSSWILEGRAGRAQEIRLRLDATQLRRFDDAVEQCGLDGGRLSQFSEAKLKWAEIRFAIVIILRHWDADGFSVGSRGRRARIFSLPAGIEISGCRMRKEGME